MWKWLKSLLAKRDDRELFVYWDGQQTRRIDPLAAWRDLWQHPDIDFGQDVKVAMNLTKSDGTPFYPEAEVDAAEQRLLTLVRKTFGVKGWTETTPGLTVNETMDLLAAFFNYRTEIKKKRSTLPTPSPRLDTTEGPDSADSTPPVSLPTTAPDCGCTGSASSAAEPTGPSKQSMPL